MAKVQIDNNLLSLSEDARGALALTVSLERIAGSLAVINSLVAALRRSEERHLPAPAPEAQLEPSHPLEWDKRPRTVVPERRLRTLMEAQ